MAAEWFPVAVSLLRDPRLVRLAKMTGRSRRETLGTLLDVWALGYDRMSATVTELDLDTVADLDGFGEAMVKVGLATVAEGGDAMRLSGLEERLDRIDKRRDAGSKGGQASWDKRRMAHETPTVAQAPVDHPWTVAELSEETRREDRSESSPEDQEPPGRVTRGVQGGPSPSKTKPRKPKATTYDELDPQTRATVDIVLEKLTARSGTPFAPSDVNVKLICARLAEGFTEMDLRGVIAFVASDPSTGGLGWEKDEKFKHFIRPATLFGPKKLNEYIDQARAFAARHAPRQPAPATGAPLARGGDKTHRPEPTTGPVSRPSQRRNGEPAQVAQTGIFGGLYDEG
jgi:uncharacterized phage protein (TIGR02220 family)